MRGQYQGKQTRGIPGAQPRMPDNDEEQPQENPSCDKMMDTICDRSRSILENLHQSEKLLDVIDGVLQGPCPDGEKMASAEGGLEGLLAECDILASQVTRRLQKLVVRLGEP